MHFTKISFINLTFLLYTVMLLKKKKAQPSKAVTKHWQRRRLRKIFIFSDSNMFLHCNHLFPSQKPIIHILLLFQIAFWPIRNKSSTALWCHFYLSIYFFKHISLRHLRGFRVARLENLTQGLKSRLNQLKHEWTASKVNYIFSTKLFSLYIDLYYKTIPKLRI